MIDKSDLFAAIIDSTDAAVISKDLDGVVQSWNPGAIEVFGWTADEMIGESIRRLIPAERQDEEDRIIARIHRGERVPRHETWRLHKDGRLIPVSIMVSPVRDRDGLIVGASKIARDLSEEVTMRTTLERAEARFHMLADNMSQLAWIADSSGALTWYNKRWFDFTGTTEQDMLGWGWTAVQHPDHLERVVERFQAAIAAGTEWEDTFPLRGADGEYRWFLSRAAPHYAADGTIDCWFGTNTDITEQRAAEHQVLLLLREVQHRSKNMLAIVQSLTRQTAKGGADFIDRLERRIAGLSANQDLLVNGNWTAIPLNDLIEAQLAFLVERRSQIELDGPRLMIRATAAEALSMALHEMATNAEKYGALSVSAGTVRIAWRTDGAARGTAAEDATFHMSWTESAGPVVQEPPERGFGSRILDSVPASKLRATVTTAFDPDGFRWELAAPVAAVIETGEFAPVPAI